MDVITAREAIIGHFVTLCHGLEMVKHYCSSTVINMDNIKVVIVFVLDLRLKVVTSKLDSYVVGKVNRESHKT